MKFFNPNNVFNIFIIPLITILLWFYPIYHYQDITISHIHSEGILYRALVNKLGAYPLIFLIINILSVLITALYISQLHSKFIFFEKRSVLHSFIFVMISSAFSSLCFVHPVFMSLLFVLFAVHQTLISYKGEKQILNFFLAGLYIGIAALFYIPAVWLFLILWTGFILLSAYGLRAFVLSLCGLLTVYLYVSVYYLVFTDIITILQDFKGIFSSKSLPELNIPQYAFAGLLVYLMLLSLFVVIKGETKQKISSWKYLIFFSFASVICTIIIIAFQDIYMLPILFIFLSILISNYFNTKKHPLFKQILLLMMVLLSIWITFYPYIFKFIKI